MFELYEKVLIKSKNIIGTIIDIHNNIYTVESDTKGRRNDGYGGEWPIFECLEHDLLKA